MDHQSNSDNSGMLQFRADSMEWKDKSSHCPSWIKYIEVRKRGFCSDSGLVRVDDDDDDDGVKGALS